MAWVRVISVVMHLSRRLAGALAVAALLGLPAPSASARHLPRRHGGHVRVAWPHRRHGRKPHAQLARFLARQTGAVRITRRMRRAARRRRHAHAAAAASVTKPLLLVRSYEIPQDDPSAARLANRSWTYDSAIAALAFLADGDSGQAVQLLDQLAALQRTDGSIDFSFNVATGESDPLFRSGAIAWVGYAGAQYDLTKSSTRYEGLTAGAARRLLARQLPSGLIAGGPNVTWTSTEHNLVAWSFLTALAFKPPSGLTSAQLAGAAARIAAAIQSQLLVVPAAGQLAFVQGSDDAQRPLDAQALGIPFLLAQGRTADAQKVAAYIESAYRVTGRSIARSTALDTFNGTWAAGGPFSGYRPYASGGPDVLWAEGTAMVRQAYELLSGEQQRAKDLGQEIATWDAVTRKAALGPLMADRTVTTGVNEYHVWPASAAASWTVLGAT
jgi:hypothetical protein